MYAVEPAHAGSTRKRRRPGLGWNPMERFRLTHLAVTQVCSQTWCELQVAYGFEIPHVLAGQQERPEMKAGADIHLSRGKQRRLDTNAGPGIGTQVNSGSYGCISHQEAVGKTLRLWKDQF